MLHENYCVMQEMSRPEIFQKKKKNENEIKEKAMKNRPNESEFERKRDGMWRREIERLK